MPLRARILATATLAAFLLTAAAWPLSYRWNALLGMTGAGVALQAGAYYLGGPQAFDSGRAELYSAERDFRLEKDLGDAPQRWKPVRIFDAPLLGTLVVVAAWVPPLLFAVPAHLGVRRWRRDRRTVARGFDVGGVAPTVGH